jgi:hypothetical protein
MRGVSREPSRDRPASLHSELFEAAGRIYRFRITDDLKHGAIGPGIAIRVTVGEIQMIPRRDGLQGTAFRSVDYVLARQPTCPNRGLSDFVCGGMCCGGFVFRCNAIHTQLFGLGNLKFRGNHFNFSW